MGAPGTVADADRGRIPRPEPAPHLPHPRGQCWAQPVSAFDLGLAFSVRWQTPRVPGPSATKAARTHPALPRSGSQRCPAGPGPQDKWKGACWSLRLGQPHPRGHQAPLLPSCVARVDPRAQQSRAHTPDPLHPSSVPTQLPSRDLPSCVGHTRLHTHAHIHTHTQAPSLSRPLPRLSTYLRRRPEGRGPARASRFSPHRAAVESHGPPPAPITKQHNNRLSEFR